MGRSNLEVADLRYSSCTVTTLLPAYVQSIPGFRFGSMLLNGKSAAARTLRGVTVLVDN